MFVLAGHEWKDAFGTYSLNAVAAAKLVPDDQNHHKSRIERLMHTLSTGHKFRSLALTAFSGEGPYVMIDGSHRAAAMLRLGILAGQSCYVGFHQQMGQDSSWFRQAICGVSRSTRETTHDGWISAPLPLTRRRRRSKSHSEAVDQGSAVDQESVVDQGSVDQGAVDQGTVDHGSTES